LDQVSKNKIFVLDTSVILHDFNAFNSFAEHDVVIPITVLEELDSFKKGNNVINLQARSFMRELDRLSENADIRSWIPLNGSDKGKIRVVASQNFESGTTVFGGDINDHRILGVATAVAAQETPRKVILVSKDINLRIKARSLGLPAEDYENIRIKDLNRIYRGSEEIEATDSSIDRFYTDGSAPAADFLSEAPVANHYFIVRGPSQSALAYYNPDSGRLEKLAKMAAKGIKPRNAEQVFALHALLNEETPLVSITGPAGTGKTLLALAGALAQRRRYRQIYLTRPLVPLSNKDIGYLPGDISSKIGPYMQPLWDNLGFIKSQCGGNGEEARRIDEMIENDKLHILPLAYIRGRSLSRIFFIVDEAQNLTPHEVKTIITRAGEGTKIVFTGDIFQIDTPYLDSHSNGLSYLVDRIRGDALYTHVNLEKGERSALANLASRLL
jgi:PhoH-like ATPase